MCTPSQRARYLFQVEETNRKIVSLLARDGRMSFTELARRTGLSVSAAQQRVRRLEERGLISDSGLSEEARDVLAGSVGELIIADSRDPGSARAAAL